MRRLHLIVGILGVVAFFGTGQYMDLGLDHLRGTPDTQRMLFRSTHVYLLLSSLVNVPLGLYFAPPTVAWRRWLASIGSALVLAGPVLFLIGFSTEPWLSELARPYSKPAIYGSLAGMIFHVISASPRTALIESKSATRRPEDTERRG